MDTEKSRQKSRRVMLIVLAVLFIAWFVYYLFFRQDYPLIMMNAQSFSLIIWSILLEALPFVLIGTFISSLIQLFVTEETIIRVLPKNNFLRLVFSALIGLIFPVCECAIIPITRSLIKKGMPVGPAIAFMIATPIVNPVVLLSTKNAFTMMPSMFIYRGVAGFIGAILIGLLVGKNKQSVLLETEYNSACSCVEEHGHAHHNHTAACSCGEHQHEHKKLTFWSALKQIFAHTNAELQSVGMYLTFGAIIATAMQLYIPREVLFSMGNGRIVSILVMMLLAFVLSLCSEADAFIASTFMLQFSSASVLAFLITGPMIDIKNTMMMLGAFKRKFVVKVISVILIVCFVIALIASLFMGGVYA